jgi:hypothetical protein
MDQDLYYKKVEGGQQLYKLIESGKVDEITLSTQNDKALKLYKKHRPVMDVENVELRPWQQQALDLLKSPTNRDVIWIRGQHGNEGKSWFQSYVRSLYGFQNVACLDMKCKASDTLFLLSKQPLIKMDMFLFNDTRAVSDNTEQCYNILEMIKDGRAVSSKYHTDVIHFRTPNVVMVFSNDYPDVRQLSMDRWKIYNIKEEGLKPFNGQLSRLFDNIKSHKF